MARNENRVVAKELRSRADAELRSLRQAKQEELQKAQFKKALGQLRTTHVLTQLKRDVAVINTVLSERQKAGEKA